MPFVKGKSGNPSGRPKVDRTIQELARSHCPDALRIMARIMRDAKVTPGVRVNAATAMLDRGYGRPPQFSTGDAAQFRRAIEMTDDELASIAAGGSERAADAPIDPTQYH